VGRLEIVALGESVHNYRCVLGFQPSGTQNFSFFWGGERAQTDPVAIHNLFLIFKIIL